MKNKKAIFFFIMIFLLLSSVNVKADLSRNTYEQMPDFYYDYYYIRGDMIIYTYYNFFYEVTCGVGPLANVGDISFIHSRGNSTHQELPYIDEYSILRERYNYDNYLNENGNFKSNLGGYSSTRTINGKIHFELAMDGDSDFPSLLTWEEYIYENGLFKAFTEFEAPKRMNAGEEWYSDNVYKLIKEGLISGYKEEDSLTYYDEWHIDGATGKYPTLPVDYTFKGDNNITISEVVTVLSKINLPPKYKYNNNFVHLDSYAWYVDFFIKGYEQGLFEGIDINNMNPDKFATREETAQLVYNSLKKEELCDEINFTDKEIIKNEYKNAISFLEKNKVLNGYLNGTFRPQSNITRGEFATILLECTQDKKDLFLGLTPNRIYAEEYVKEYFVMKEEDRPLFNIRFDVSGGK